MNLGSSYLPPIVETTEDLLSELTLATEAFGQLENMIPEECSTEALLAVLGNIKSVNNRFVDAIKNLKITSKSKFSTEYGEWSRKKRVQIMMVEKKNYGDLLEVSIPVPAGMVGRYPDVQQTMSALNKAIEIHAFLGVVMQTVDAVHVSISNANSDCEGKLTSARIGLRPKLKAIKELSAKLDGMFDSMDNSEKTVPFKTSFSSMAELKTFRKDLGVLAVDIAKVADIDKSVDTISKSIATSVDYIVEDHTAEDEFQPSKEFVAGYIAFLGDVTDTIHTFGALSLRTMAIIHNVTFVYSKLAER